MDSTVAWAEFRAAVAVRNVTPDPLLAVSGGVGSSKAANKKNGELTVRARWAPLMTRVRNRRSQKITIRSLRDQK